MSFVASITLMGKTFIAEGTSSADALEKLVIPPSLAKGSGLLTMSNGSKTEERILSRVITQRLFSRSPMIREIQLKQVGARFSI